MVLELSVKLLEQELGATRAYYLVMEMALVRGFD